MLFVSTVRGCFLGRDGTLMFGIGVEVLGAEEGVMVLVMMTMILRTRGTKLERVDRAFVLLSL